MTKTFLLLLFFISNNIYKVNGQNLFSEIKGSKIIIEDKTFSSLSFSVGLPIKIVKKECELYFENLGKINVVKKINYHNISSNRKDYQKLELKTSIEKHKAKNECVMGKYPEPWCRTKNKCGNPEGNDNTMSWDFCLKDKKDI